MTEPLLIDKLPPSATKPAVVQSRPNQLRAGTYRTGASSQHLVRTVFVFGTALVTVLAADWVALAALILLWVGWKYLSREPGAPIAAAAFTHQWVQVTIGVFYAAITGRQVIEMRTTDYRPMVLVGLGSILAMFGGYLIGAAFPKRRTIGVSVARPLPLSLRQIAICYIAAVAINGTLQNFAWTLPRVTQILLVLSLGRFALLFILVTRLLRPPPRWGWIAAIALMELALGFGGLFADFRQPLVIVGIALMGRLNLRNVRTWLVISALAVTSIVAAIAWTAIKPAVRATYTRDRDASKMDRVGVAASTARQVLSTNPLSWQWQTDLLVSRLWQIYYPSLALARVPSVLPHEDGALLKATITNILTPRFLFPDKGNLASDSEKVRKYSGVWVAGREVGTSFAFGYAAESYVDFGIPLMFLPIFFYGLAMGVVRRHLASRIRHTDLRDGVIAVIFWSSLYLFEVSWVMMVGLAIVQIVAIGGVALLVDRAVSKRAGRRVHTAQGQLAGSRRF